jgi:hypothetical protein
MKVIYALVFVALDKITLIDVLPTKSSCEYYRDLNPNSICVPVTVEDPKEVIQQLQALQTITR